MNSNKNKLIFSITTIFLIIVVSLLIYQKEHKKLALTTQKTTTKSIVKAIPLKYIGSTLLNEFNKTTIENYPTAAGTYDLATMASAITLQMLQTFSTTGTKTLPLVANWNVGIPEYSDGLNPLYMINRLTNGEHIVPTWKLDPYYNDAVGLSYYETSIKKAAELGLPLVFTLPSPESALTKDDVYFTMDKTNNPNVITPKGIVLPKLSPFGPNSLWNEVGGQWSTTSLMAQLQEWYPNPPLVIFIDEDSASKLSWSELSNSSRYQTQYPLNGSDEFKRTLVNAHWVEKYRQLHQGFMEGFTSDAWKKNTKFITRNQLAINMGMTNDWQNGATTTNLHANIWPLTADGLTINFSLDKNKTQLNNLPFMLDEAKASNPNFVSQLSIDANQQITNPNIYRGYTQLALWLLRPNIIRQTSHETIKVEINPLFQQVVDSVELINNNEILADFWKNGKLVKTGNSNYNLNIPTKYQTVPREFFLKTDATIPVYAFALEKGMAPNREWLIYTQSSSENVKDITITIPWYKDVLANSSTQGLFSIIKESYKQNSITDIHKYDKIQAKIDSLLASTKIARDSLKDYRGNTSYNYGKEFFVSPNGSDNNLGTKDSPFFSLEKARDSVRAYKNSQGLPAGGIVIWLRKGTYSLNKIFRLTEKDSGEDGKPIAYRAYKNEDVHLIGGIELKSKWFSPVSSTNPVWSRLDSDARNYIKVIDLAAHGITDFGTLEENRYASIVPPELFQGDKDLTLARWPDKNVTTSLPTINDNSIHIYGNLSPNVTGEYKKENKTSAIYKRKGLVDGKQYFIKRIEGITNTTRRSWIISENNNIPLWSHSGLGYGLPREFTIAHGDARGIPSLIKSSDKQFGFAFMQEGLNDTSFKYFGNRPSHWKNTGDIWINGMLKYPWANVHSKIKNINNGIITLEEKPLYGIKQGIHKMPYYVYNVLEELSTEGEYYIDRDSSKLYVYPKTNLNQTFTLSTNPQALIYLNNTSWIEFHGLTIEMGRKCLIEIKDGEHNLIDNCKLQFSGKSLIKISGTNTGITNSELTGSGEEAMSLSGGNRSSLTAGLNFAINNHIHDINRWKWTSKGAVKLSGVGNIFEHNDVHGLMHQAINFTGNNHRIQYNNIYNVITYSGDAGVIYSGRNWGWRGNKVNYNFIHDIINNYGDTSINGIYFDDSLSGNEAIGNIFYNIDGNGIFMNGGRDNTMESNLFHKVATVYVGTNYGFKSITNQKNSSFNLLQRLKEDNVNYKSGIWATAYPRLAKMPNNWEDIKKGGWLSPGGNSFKNNTFGEVLRIKRLGTISTALKEGNLIHYKNFETENKNDTSKIPFNEIGIQH